MRMVSWLVFSLALGPGWAWSPPPASAVPQDRVSARGLSVDDLFRIQDLADPRISPDGRWVAFTATIGDLAADQRRTRIWMVPAAGGEAVPLTSRARTAWSPRWRPGGLHIAFLAEDSAGRTQVWTLYRHGGEAVQLTDVPQGVEDYAWSPDGKRLVLVLRDTDATGSVTAASNGSTPERRLRPWVIDRLQFKADGVGYLDGRRTHLYVLDLGTKVLTQATSGSFDDSAPSWSPSGRSIVFVSNRSENPDGNYNTDLWLVEPESRRSIANPRRLTRGPGPDRAPAWSPDGSLVVYVCSVNVAAMEYATRRLAVVREDGAGGERLVTPELDRNVESPRFTDEGRSIVFILEDRGERNLARVPVLGGSVSRIVGGRQIVDAFDVGPQGSLATLQTEPHVPAEIFLHEGDSPRRLTHANDDLLRDLRLGEVEKIHFESADGTPVEAFLVRPPDFVAGGRRPTVLWAHGGPQAQYDWRFDFHAQLLAASGYVVVLPNARGSTGYGEAFCLGLWQGWGAKDYPDFMAAIDHVIGMGLADAERLGVGGWSYGGYATNGIITRTNRFRAAISGASAVLYAANYGHDQWQLWWETEWGLPWRNRSLWERHSPFNDIEKVRTPTLVIGAEEDWNVPVQNSEQLYLALRRLGQVTQLVVYPGESHAITRPSFVKDRYERYLSWFGEHLRGQRPVVGDPGQVRP